MTSALEGNQKIGGLVLMVTSIRGDPNWWISYLQTSFMYRLKERERELGRDSRRKGEGKEGGKASKVRARARSHKPQRRRRPFSKAGPKAFTMARTPPLSIVLDFPSARCLPSPAGQKDELLGKEVGLQCSTWSECTMLEVVSLL